MEKALAIIARYPRLCALLAGGVSATGFAPLNLWFLTLLCLALLMHLAASAESGKRALLLGWLFGVGHFSVGNNWIATAFTYQDAMPVWLGWIAVVLLALYLAVYPALACWGAWWVAKFVAPAQAGASEGLAQSSRDKPAAVPAFAGTTFSFILAFAGCWIITEWLRSWVFTGFAWNPLSAAMLDVEVDRFSPTFGTYGASGWVVFVSGAISEIWQYARRWLQNYRSNVIEGGFEDSDPRSVTGKAAYGAYIIVGLIALIANRWLLDNRYETANNVTIVQPNISQIDKYKPAYEAVNFVRIAQHSRPKDDKPRLLLWPEAAIPWWLEDGYPPQAYRDQPGGTAAATRQALARLLGPDDILLTGADRLEFGKSGEVAGARNSVLAIDAKGEILATYDKAHLVPFGEYLALRWLLEPLGATRLVPGTLDFWPGPGPRTLNLGKGKPKVGMQICYEIIFSGQVVDRANRPDFIFNPSNDAWFGSWGSPQFVAQSRLRAIEEGLPVIRATPTGISAVIDADGRVVDSLPLGKAGRIDGFLPEAKAPTLFARHGNILPLGFAALLIALAFLPLARRRFSR